MENNFLKIDFKYINRKDISFLQSGILAYLSGFQNNKLYCYQSERELAEIFNSSRRTISRSIIDLINKGLIFKSNDRKYLIPFQNRKALILVDDNNPLPTTEKIVKQSIPKKEYVLPIVKTYTQEETIIDNPMPIAETEAGQDNNEKTYVDKAKDIGRSRKEQAIKKEVINNQSKNRIEELLANAPKLNY
jgi:DNA-binding transcriptional regulator YhcF (GntR family)